MHATARQLILGTLDPSSSLHRLAGHVDVLATIWAFVQAQWASDLLTSTLAANSTCVAYSHLDTTKFPEPNERYVNMMPFDMEDIDNTLPPELHVYKPMIEQCLRSLAESERRKKLARRQAALESAKAARDSVEQQSHLAAAAASPSQLIGYLTVHESVVKAGSSQRRPGLHTEGFRLAPHDAGKLEREPFWHGWGFGDVLRPGVVEGGIFMASNVDNSTHVYNALVPPALVGAGGDVEHLRPTLERTMGEPPRPRVRRFSYNTNAHAPMGSAHQDLKGARVKGPISLQANELWWITDRTCVRASKACPRGIPRRHRHGQPSSHTTPTLRALPSSLSCRLIASSLSAALTSSYHDPPCLYTVHCRCALLQAPPIDGAPRGRQPPVLPARRWAHRYLVRRGPMLRHASRTVR